MDENSKHRASFFNNPLMRTRIKSANVKLPEIIFGYFIGPIGALLASGIFTSFLNNYWTDVLFAGQLTESVNTFLTLLPLLSAILIVIGNLIAGQIIERTKTRAGKARPYILLSAVLLGASCIIMFISPSDDPVAKMVITAISYNLYYSVAYPLYNTANSTLIPVSIRSGKQRGLLASATNVAGLAVMGAGSMVFPVIASWVLKTQGAWTVAFIIVGIVTFVACVLQYYFTRERVTEETYSENTIKHKLPVKQQLGAVTKDKFWWIIIIFYLVFQLSGAMKNLSMVYFCKNVLDSFLGMDAGAMQSVLAILGAVPMAIAVVIIWPLSNKFNKQIVTFVGMVIGVIGGVIAGLFSTNFIAVAIGVALKCLGSSPACYMILAMISDCLDHIEAKNGFRCDGLTMSIYSSIMVAASPIAQAVFNGLLAATGYIAPAEGQIVTQPDAVVSMLSVSYIWVETIAYAVCAVLMIFFGVEKFLKKDQETILENQKAAALAAGEEWIEPAERLRREEEEAERLADEARKMELKARCEKKGLSYEEEEARYQAKLEEKRLKAEAAANARKAKAEAEEAKKNNKEE